MFNNAQRQLASVFQSLDAKDLMLPKVYVFCLMELDFQKVFITGGPRFRV